MRLSKILRIPVFNLTIEVDRAKKYIDLGRVFLSEHWGCAILKEIGKE
jgi:hypothetical protein